MPVKPCLFFVCYLLDDMTGGIVFHQFPDLQVRRQVDECDGSSETMHVAAWSDTSVSIETLRHLDEPPKNRGRRHSD